MIAALVYVAGACVTLLCAVLLLRQYARTRMPLLLWAGLCFAGLTVSNAIVFVDLVILPTAVSLYETRLAVTAIAMSLLLYGLIWEDR